MKTAVYIGIYSRGSTSKMRADKLKSLLPGWKFEIIDTDIPFMRQRQPFRSLGFRYQFGPLVTTVNRYVLSHLTGDAYDLVWVDKAILITRKTTEAIRRKTDLLVHYTPDTAFYGNRSKLFYESMEYYDYLVTTKSFEYENYRSRVPEKHIIRTTQGFDSDIHKPIVSFTSKENRVVFVGLWEPSREKLLQHLLNNNIKIALAGFNWSGFVRKNKRNANLEYCGTSLWNEEYVKLIASSHFSLGLLSKRFPELHTTRTLEIPACGTALLTEFNEETSTMFSDEEAIFFRSEAQLVQQIKYYTSHQDQLQELTARGLKKVNDGGFDYQSILSRILNTIMN